MKIIDKKIGIIESPIIKVLDKYLDKLEKLNQKERNTIIETIKLLIEPRIFRVDMGQVSMQDIDNLKTMYEHE